MGARYTETPFVASATNTKCTDEGNQHCENGYENPDLLLPNHQYEEMWNIRAHPNSNSDHGYERVPTATVGDVYERAQTYESAQTYERAQIYERVHHLDLVSQTQSLCHVDQSSTASGNDHYEKAQVYEKAQTYERVHHCDIPLPQSTQDSITKEVTDTVERSDPVTESGYERARTYECIHHCDISLHLQPQTKQSDDGLDLEPVNVNQSTSSQSDQVEHENMGGEGATASAYEQVHHCDVSLHLLPLSNPSQEHANSIEHSAPPDTLT